MVLKVTGRPNYRSHSTDVSGLTLLQQRLTALQNTCTHGHVNELTSSTPVFLSLPRMAAVSDLSQQAGMRPQTSWPKSKAQNKRRKGDGQGPAPLCALEALQHTAALLKQ